MHAIMFSFALFRETADLKISAYLLLLAVCPLLRAADPGQWPKWRGPGDDGMARSDAPLRWSDTENIKWKATIPGRGHSSPVVWGDKIFVTTAVPTAPVAAGGAPQRRRRGDPSGGDSGPQSE